jgi:beta-glucosidase
MPADGLGEKVNEQGVAFYNDLINFMIAKGGRCFT